jgi:hypothetical protein
MEMGGPLPCSQQPSVIPVLNKINLVHTLTPYVFKIDLNFKWGYWLRIMKHKFILRYEARNLASWKINENWKWGSWLSIMKKGFKLQNVARDLL